VRAAHLRQQMVDERLRHRAYTREVGDDMPDTRDWTCPGGGGRETPTNAIRGSSA
jgi:xylulose-5-phosphate/fructose-6-phosphate phosphoketolase